MTHRWKIAGATCALFAACSSAPVPEMEAAKDPAALLGEPIVASELPAAEGTTSVVFRGEEGEAGFNLHSYLIRHDGKFWAMWSSAAVHEEDPDQLVRFATSEDGRTWSEAQVLAADPDGAEGPQRWIARGFFEHGGRLHALAALVESADYGDRGQGVVWAGLRLMRFTLEDGAWSEGELFADNCMNNFPPEKLGAGWGLVCRDDRMDVSMALADDLATPEWELTPLAADPPFEQMDEPTWYRSDDGVTHMIIRDNGPSRKLIHAVSRDEGATWDKPVLSDYPDARSKNFTGRLSDGRFFLINNPNPEGRDPLAISFSEDGWTFSGAEAIRKGAPVRRYFGGRAGAAGSFQYPHALEHEGSLWVIYSTNKEDIEITELPLH